MPGTRPSLPSCCSSWPSGWPAGPSRLGASLKDFAGNAAYNLGQLRQDLDRFTFLPGGDDGEPLVGPGTAE